MPNTTNYNWATPADTDLVKDGAAAIRTLGSSIDTTTKNLNPETTTGDIAYRSATANVNTRLALGTANQVLRVNSGGTAPEWATTADQTPLTTKGDLFTFDTADARLGVGANNTVLTADSAEATGLKWAAPAGTSFVGASVYPTGDVTLSNNTWTLVTFTNETYDTNSFHDNSTNTGRMTIPSGKAGYYLFNYRAQISAGSKAARLYKNGSAIGWWQTSTQSDANDVVYTAIWNASVGDYFEIYVKQQSGGSATLYGTFDYNNFQIAYLGA